MTKPFRSNFNSTKPNLGQANILADWNRSVACGQIVIDGKDARTLVQIKENGAYFSNDQEVKDFFKVHLLKNIADEDKKASLDYLMKSLHQGGLLRPVGSCAPEIMVKHDVMMSADHQSKNYFVTSDSGFSVQEICNVPWLAYLDPEKTDKNGEPEKIRPDAGNASVFDAQTTLAIDFKNIKLQNEPKISLISSSITYGSETAKKILDSRTLFEKIVDWLKSVFNSHTCEEVSIRKLQPDTHKWMQKPAHAAEAIQATTPPSPELNENAPSPN